MPQYALLLRDSGGFPDDISPEEIQAIIARYRDWMEKVKGSGQKLRDGEGRVAVRRDGALTITDGPYAEAKEVLGGFFLVEAPDYAAMARLVEDCPHLDFGSIEIREIEAT
jgi:hypothetical protein